MAAMVAMIRSAWRAAFRTEEETAIRVGVVPIDVRRADQAAAWSLVRESFFLR